MDKSVRVLVAGVGQTGFLGRGVRGSLGPVHSGLKFFEQGYR